MPKEIRYDAQAREAILRGVRTLADAVLVTLGPKGRNVVIEKSWGSSMVTKDGVTVANKIEIQDKFENMGAQMVKEAASKTSDMAGDGTTTATVLARAIYENGQKLNNRFWLPLKKSGRGMFQTSSTPAVQSSMAMNWSYPIPCPILIRASQRFL